MVSKNQVSDDNNYFTTSSVSVLTKKNETKPTAVSSPKSIKSGSSHSKIKSLKKSETQKSSTARFTLPCCHKILELNPMRLISLIGMLIAVIGVVIIAIITIYTFVKTSFPVFRTLKLFGDCSRQYNNVIISENLAVFSKDDSKIALYNESKLEMIGLFNELFELLPESAAKVYPNSSTDASTLYLFPLLDKVIKLTTEKNYSEAIKAYMEPQHFSIQSSFLNDYFLFVDQLRNISNSQQDLISSNSTAYLIVVLICLVISIPIGVAIFVSVLRMERKSREKLIKAKKLQLQGVLASVVKRSLFKNWICSNMNDSNMKHLNRFNLLEDIQTYKSPEKQEIQNMKNFLEDLKDLSTDDSFEQDTVSESSEAYSINTSATSFSSKRGESTFSYFIYDKYLNPMGATNYVKTKGYKKVEEFIKEKSQNFNKPSLFDEVQEEVIISLIPIFEKFQAYQSLKESKQLSNTGTNLISESKVLQDFRLDFKDFLKNYEKLIIPQGMNPIKQ